MRGASSQPLAAVIMVDFSGSFARCRQATGMLWRSSPTDWQRIGERDGRRVRVYWSVIGEQVIHRVGHVDVSLVDPHSFREEVVGNGVRDSRGVQDRPRSLCGGDRFTERERTSSTQPHRRARSSVHRRRSPDRNGPDSTSRAGGAHRLRAVGLHQDGAVAQRFPPDAFRGSRFSFSTGKSTTVDAPAPAKAVDALGKKLQDSWSDARSFHEGGALDEQKVIDLFH